MDEWTEELVRLTAQAIKRQMSSYGRANFDSAYACVFPKTNFPPDAMRTYKSGVKREIRKMGLLDTDKKFSKKDRPTFSPKTIVRLSRQSRGMIHQENLP